MKTLTKVMANTIAALELQSSSYMLGSCCHAVVAVAPQTHCKQSFVVLGARRAQESSWALVKVEALARVVQSLPGPVLNSVLASLPLFQVYHAKLPLQALSLSAKLPSFGFFFSLQVPLISLHAPHGTFLFSFIWFPCHPAASRLVACLHHPKLCCFSHVFVPGICCASINPVIAHV